MAISDNSYGSLEGIAAIANRWASGGTFDDTTTPTGTQAEGWINQVSALMNSLLSEYSFDIPVTNDDVKLVLDMFINSEVASMVLGIHGSGRFAPKGGKSAGTGKSRFTMILDDFADYLQTHSYSLSQLGAGGGTPFQMHSSYDIDVESLIDRASLSWED